MDALTPLIGESAKNLSPGVISRLKAEWEGEYHAFRRRDLSKKRYVYFWADGIHLQARMENSSECVLVIIGATEQWAHIRTTNPIESTFATVRHRTYKSKGAFSRTTIWLMLLEV